MKKTQRSQCRLDRIEDPHDLVIHVGERPRVDLHHPVCEDYHVPFDFEGEVPSGYYAGRSKTWKVVVFIRLFPVGGDIAKALLSAKDIKIYPLAKAGQPVTFRYIDVSAKTMSLPVLSWETNNAVNTTRVGFLDDISNTHLRYGRVYFFFSGYLNSLPRALLVSS